MIQTSVHASDELVLRNALLLYRPAHGGEEYVAMHDVEHTPQGPIIGAGQPVTKAALQRMLLDLGPKKQKQPVEIIPANLLSKSPNHLAWYCEPKDRQVWFKCEQLGGEVTKVVPHPGLVFVVSQSGWHVFAVKGNQRPQADTELCVAPYLNCWEGGGICTGNVTTPKGKMRWNTTAWEEAFFRSYFTHINIQGKNKLVKFGKGAYAFWRSMLAGNHKKFPEKYLVATGMTLSQTLQRVLKGGR